MENNIQTYSAAIARLEEIMSQIQGGNMDIDKLGTLLTEAQQLIEFCRGRLFKVDEEIKSLLDTISDEEDADL